MSRAIVFGAIEGINEGHLFHGRKEMMPSSFHRNWAAGIDGNGTVGASAIVLSGGYEDDEDRGDEIVYTGAGGNDPNTGKQVEDQTWQNKGNAGLRVSMDKGLPVRVVRGSGHKSTFSPKSGYLYAGLFSVVDAWEEVGRSGYKICRFRLVYSGSNGGRQTVEETEFHNYQREKRYREDTVLRIIRDTKIARDIKELYNYTCQVCGHVIPTPSGKYAEGAHIKPLGKPHDGADSMDNLICLCPNHHIMFDRGSFSIEDDLSLLGALAGKLVLHPKHILNKINLQYHRKTHGYN